MNEINRIFLLNIIESYPAVLSYLFCVVGSVSSGLLIGWEREKANKPAGLRTFAFVALGATIFTLASTLAAGAQGDRARIAAQIVTGIGFIGAGAVFKSGKIVSGLTTAAGIWATGAIGVVFGLGYFVFGLCAAALVLALFYMHTIFEMRSMGVCEFSTIEISFEDPKGKYAILIDDIIETGMITGPKLISRHKNDAKLSYKLRYCSKHKAHRYFLNDLASCSVDCLLTRKAS